MHIWRRGDGLASVPESFTDRRSRARLFGIMISTGRGRLGLLGLGLRASPRLRILPVTFNVNEAYAATWASVDAPIGWKDSGVGSR